MLLAQCGDIEPNPGPNANGTEAYGSKIDLTIMTQNCRGLQDYNKMRLILKNKNVSMNKNKTILALQETYLMQDDWINWIKWSGNYVFSRAASPHSAGCITYFNDYVRVIEVKQIDDQGHGHIAVVEGLMTNIVIVANIYSPVRSLTRDQENFYNEMFEIIEELELKYFVNEPNLIITGDFNLPLESDRGYYSSEAEFERAMSLVERFESKGLVDSWKDGDTRYTYKTACSRLDRILFRLNVPYKEKLETDWTFTNSDHCLMRLSLCSLREKVNHDRVVSLPTYLLENEEARVLIRDKMMDMVKDCPTYWESRVRLEYFKMCLRTTVGEVSKLLNKRQNEELGEIQRSISWRMGLRNSLPLNALESNDNQLELLFTKRNLILNERCKKLAEKAKTRWFYEGEKANKYFLNLLNKRRGLQEIEKLVVDRGEITDPSEIDEEINKFYKELYERGEPINKFIDDRFFEHVNKVDTVKADGVVSPLSKEEIYQVLLTCKDSAPGPDGIPYSYYKHFWSIFGDALAQSWSEALLNGNLPDSHKTSILRLLPKTGKDTSKLTNWRPITLSNCDHKLITKCFARRITNVLGPCLHPNQTAYQPEKQIQDNLRVINIVNEASPETLVVSLDAKKAFDSVSHDYIRSTLVAYGLESFVPVFNLLYEQQRVNIHVNGRKLDGYQIRNGVKQGDSLSCILFIMCMDPLIRNIEANPSIMRAELLDIPLPKSLAYADDITCVIERDVNSVQGIFREYGRLTRASVLSLNADKTEILDLRENRYKVKYEGNEHILQGSRSVKINGIVFNKDINLMKTDNFNYLVGKIEKMLMGWRARQLSLLGKILIYKTFGMSQVIYVLSIISLSVAQYKKLDKMFYNFLWGRDLGDTSTRARIGRERLNTPIEYGGFGMVDYESVLEGVYCRQLAKLYNAEFMHPLKLIIVKNDSRFATGKSLTTLADDVSKKAHELLTNLLWKDIKALSNQQIADDVILTNQLGAREIEEAVKPRWIYSPEANRLVYGLGCNNLKDVLDRGREAVRISKKIFKAKYVRIIRTLWQAHCRPEEVIEDRFKMLGGNYKPIYKVKSKEFRELIKGPPRFTSPRLAVNVDVDTNEGRMVVKNYFNTVKRLANTRHKNTLLRIWNGDCLSNTRLVHFGLVDSNICPNCAAIDTPSHMLVECQVAEETWNRIMLKIPKRSDMQIIEYVTGLYDGKLDMSIKAEVLKMLMHFRNLNAEAIYRRLKNYFLTVKHKSAYIRQLFVE
jgi:exonuclease III